MRTRRRERGEKTASLRVSPVCPPDSPIHPPGGAAGPQHEVRGAEGQAGPPRRHRLPQDPPRLKASPCTRGPHPSHLLVGPTGLPRAPFFHSRDGVRCPTQCFFGSKRHFFLERKLFGFAICTLPARIARIDQDTGRGSTPPRHPRHPAPGPRRGRCCTLVMRAPKGRPLFPMRWFCLICDGGWGPWHTRHGALKSKCNGGEQSFISLLHRDIQFQDELIQFGILRNANFFMLLGRIQHINWRECELRQRGFHCFF